MTQGGFVNLTHVNARKMEIIWEEEDLLNLFARRVRESAEFVAEMPSPIAPTEAFSTRFSRSRWIRALESQRRGTG